MAPDAAQLSANPLLMPAISLQAIQDFLPEPDNSAFLPAANGVAGSVLDELIATILSQNTTDKNNSRAFQALKFNFHSWDELCDATPESIANIINCAGLAKQKTATILNILRYLQTIQKGPVQLEFLSKYEDEKAFQFLTSFPGIGIKTAACVLMFALNRRICAVDTHVHRILNRTGIVQSKNPDQTFILLQDRLNQEINVNPGNLHLQLISLGRTICTARNAYCVLCPLRSDCPSASSN
jgi:endonuclease-3